MLDSDKILNNYQYDAFYDGSNHDVDNYIKTYHEIRIKDKMSNYSIEQSFNEFIKYKFNIISINFLFKSQHNVIDRLEIELNFDLNRFSYNSSIISKLDINGTYLDRLIKYMRNVNGTEITQNKLDDLMNIVYRINPIYYAILLYRKITTNNDYYILISRARALVYYINPDEYDNSSPLIRVLLNSSNIDLIYNEIFDKISNIIKYEGRFSRYRLYNRERDVISHLKYSNFYNELDTLEINSKLEYNRKIEIEQAKLKIVESKIEPETKIESKIENKITILNKNNSVETQLIDNGVKKIIKKILNISDKDMTTKSWTLFEKTISIWKNTKLDCIPTYIDTGKTDTSIWFTYEYIEGHNLIEWKRDKTDDYIKNFIIKLLTSVNRLHKMNIIHRDLKPSNIIIDNNLNVFIIDLNSSTTSDLSKNSTTIVYSHGYTPADVIYTPSTKSDIYSIGAIWFELLYNKQFLEYNDINIVEIGILKRMLDLNPNNRPTIDEIISELELDEKSVITNTNQILIHPIAVLVVILLAILSLIFASYLWSQLVT